MPFLANHGWVRDCQYPDLADSRNQMCGTGDLKPAIEKTATISRVHKYTRLVCIAPAGLAEEHKGELSHVQYPFVRNQLLHQ